MIEIPLVFASAYLLSLSLLSRARLGPRSAAVAGGISAHMALLAGHYAAEVPKSLAEVKPVFLVPMFAYATLVTSAAFIASIKAAVDKRSATADALVAGLAVFNVPLGLSVANGAASLTPYADPALLSIGAAALGLVEAFALSAVASASRRITPLWPTPPAAFFAGCYLYGVLPPMLTDIYPKLVAATAYAAAAPLILYSMFKNNIAASAALGGLTSFRFWAAVFAGVMAFAAAEIPLLLYNPQMHALLG
ncbi:hypothetical protein TUZN_1103 [Thermoproteus uzoniensis 768-20]|uniref:Uncharacterized protein n=1 Tax=Thermoproteus uzoniensis (strain 768-20) TaxID=999630 RepID=F2L0A1_THEU7|nr:hypothetical protein [Thermoproteus uzoniensis]AEA12583.1 hypothetical protein TUZN_1103 [Thermoproteus uzoniensis 768-20]